MVRAKISTRNQLITTMKKFKFEEFEKTVLSVFPEITWSEIRSRLMKQHHRFNSVGAAKVIEKKLNVYKIDEKDLKERLAQLQVLEVSRHSRKKYWYGYELKSKETNSESFLPNHEMADRIHQCFLNRQITMVVKLVTYQGITYASLTEKKKSKLFSPVYLAFFLRQRYFFCAKKYPTKEFLQTILESLKCDKLKKLDLTGRDLMSLMKIRQMKKNGTVNCENLWNPPVYKPAQPIFRKTGIDFRQHNQRRKYLSQCFGENPPTIDVLTMTCSEVSWEDKNPKLENLKIQFDWEFKSPDVPQMLLHLAENRVLANPIPNYITKWMESGKTHLKLQN